MGLVIDVTRSSPYGVLTSNLVMPQEDRYLLPRNGGPSATTVSSSSAAQMAITSGELVSLSEVRGHRGIGHGLFTCPVNCDLIAPVISPRTGHVQCLHSCDTVCKGNHESPLGRQATNMISILTTHRVGTDWWTYHSTVRFMNLYDEGPLIVLWHLSCAKDLTCLAFSRTIAGTTEIPALQGHLLSQSCCGRGGPNEAILHREIPFSG